VEVLRGGDALREPRGRARRAQFGADDVRAELDGRADRLVDTALAELGGIDLLVNNVGIGDAADLVQGAVLELADLPDAAWAQTFDLHFYSALRAIRAAMPSLVEPKGTVVNVSPAGARLVTAGPVHYNVAKAALNALTKVVAQQYGSRGVRAITVAPGPVSTGVWTDSHGLIGGVVKSA